MGLNLPLFIATGVPIWEDDNDYSSYKSKPKKDSQPEHEPSFSSMPMNPVVGQRWFSISSGKYYTFNGEAWILTSPPAVIYSNKEPYEPKDGDLWIC